MTLRQKQAIFWLDVAKTLLFANDAGTPIVITQWMRDPSQQQNLVAAGKSWTLNSKHLIGLAIDFAFIADLVDDNIMNYALEKYRPIGEYWETLSLVNRWGGRFGIDIKDYKDKIGKDCDHLEYNR